MEPSLDLLDRLNRVEPHARVFDKLQRRIAYRERAARRWWSAAAAAAVLLVAGEAYMLRGYFTTGQSTVLIADNSVAQLVPTYDNTFSYD